MKKNFSYQEYLYKIKELSEAAQNSKTCFFICVAYQNKLSYWIGYGAGEYKSYRRLYFKQFAKRDYDLKNEHLFKIMVDNSQNVLNKEFLPLHEVLSKLEAYLSIKELETI